MQWNYRGSTATAWPSWSAEPSLPAGSAPSTPYLLAFDQDADYDSLSFLWCRSRYRRFVYIDRVVVARSARGRGHARRLYDDLFAQALGGGHDRIVCEVNREPPNPAPDSFHAALGFAEAGSARLPDGMKTVRYLARRLPG